MDKHKRIAAIETQVYFPNVDDWKEDFWKRDYLITLASQGVPFAVNADNEQAALDYVIDYCEDNLPGLLMSQEEIDEEEYLNDYICGGNHGRYLNTMDISIELL